MKPLYTEYQFKNAKSDEKLLLMCYQCDEHFERTKHEVQRFINPNQDKTGEFCSIKCSTKYRSLSENMNCTNCDKEFNKKLKDIKKSKSGNHFCCQSCAASYNNKHKTHGTRRSKLEIWFEEELTSLYPNLPIDFNKKDAIGSELDIYIPSLNLAIELNGIFHYEPIFGKDKLGKIQENDISKSKACIDSKIDLCIIDTSQQKYVKPKTSQKYLDIIINIIKERLTS